MACPTRQKALQDYLAGDLPAAERGALEVHLRACASCRRDLALYRAILGALPELPEREAPAALHNDLMRALRPEREFWRRERETRTRRILTRAATVAFATAFGVSLSVALWGWLGRIGGFAAERFSADAATLWSAVRDLWTMVQLLGDIMHTLEPTAVGLWDLTLRSGAPIAAWGPLLLAGYAAVLALGSWLCWRALHMEERRGLSHVS